VYANGTVYHTAVRPDRDTQYLHARDASDGSRLWTYEAADTISWPTVASDTIYCSHGEYVTALDPGDGSPRWQVDIGTDAGSPIVAGEAIFVVTNSSTAHNNEIVALHDP
jgi:outer membrane protein assembly factor BamB